MKKRSKNLSLLTSAPTPVLSFPTSKVMPAPRNGEVVEAAQEPSPAGVPEGDCRGADPRAELTEEDWRRLLKKTERFARREINRQKWRGAHGGILPQGCDTSSIAAEVIGGCLQERRRNKRSGSSANSMNSSARINCSGACSAACAPAMPGAPLSADN